MYRALATAVVALSLLAAPAAQAQGLFARKAAAPAAGLPFARSPEAVGFDSARLARLDAAMAAAVAEGQVVGLSTLLARHGQVVQFRQYGKARDGATMAPDTIFRIYSMSKPITGAAMMILFEEGRWSLDDPVTKHVPEFKDLKVWDGVGADGKPKLVNPKRPPTMREVMSHTAGFGYGLDDKHGVDKLFREKKVLESQGLDQLIERVASIPLMYEPGTRWSYSIAVDIQGYIVQKLSGQPYGQFLQARLFGPLGMKDTAFQVSGDQVGRLGALYYVDPRTNRMVDTSRMPEAQDYAKPPPFESGGGGLVSTIQDYARFSQMVANDGTLDGVRILTPASIELMRTDVIPESGRITSDGTSSSWFSKNVGFGLGFMVDKDPRADGSLAGKDTMSWGGAAGTWFWVDPTNDVVFVGMIQRFGPAPKGLGPDPRTTSQRLVYGALVDPEK